jgi:hypothetical protein
MRKRNRNVMRALSDDPSVIARFWDNVRRTDVVEGCWEWSGYMRPNGNPAFCVGQFALRATHVAWFTHTGELPAVGRLVRICTNHRCVRPSHLAWTLGRTAKRCALTMSDGYLSLTGVPVVAAGRASNEPRLFRVLLSDGASTAPEAA